MQDLQLNESNLNLLGIRDLRRLAFSVGVYGYTRYSKAKLIEHILAVVGGNEPAKTESCKGRPTIITQSRKEVFDDIANKLRNVETFKLPTLDSGLALVASSSASYDTGRNDEYESLKPKIPDQQLVFGTEKMRPVDVFAPIAYGSRALVFGNEHSVSFAQKLVVSCLDKKNTILIVPDASPEEILEFEDFGMKVFSTSFGESFQQTKQTVAQAFAHAKQLANQQKNPVVVISSLTKLSKCFAPDSVSAATLGETIDQESLTALKKLCLLCRANQNNSSITLIAFAQNNSPVDNIFVEHMKSVFSTEIELDQTLALAENVFPISISKSFTKKPETFQTKTFLAKQKEIRQKLASGEFDNKKALESLN